MEQELDFKLSDDKEYKIEKIENNRVYVNKVIDKLPVLYHLIF